MSDPMYFKRSRPGPAPARPAHVELLQLNTVIAHQAGGGALPDDLRYLQQFAPTLLTDEYGEPLPLPITDQERLDRQVAVLREPFVRGRQLVTSGTLDTDEADALRLGAPDEYQGICDDASAAIINEGPPFPAWASGVLGILFGKDAAVVYGEGAKDQNITGSQQGSKFPGKPPLPTPADQVSDPLLTKGSNR
jgi:hypothetical protein